MYNIQITLTKEALQKTERNYEVSANFEKYYIEDDSFCYLTLEKPK